VPAAAKSFHANEWTKKENKNGVQQHLYAMPFGTLRIAKPLCAIPPIGRPHIGFQSKRLSA